MNSAFCLGNGLRQAVMVSVVLLPCLSAQPGRRLETPAERSLVTVVRVRPELLTEWLDLQRNVVVPALKKAGVKSRAVYTSGVFGEAFEYTIVQPMTGFREFDSAEGQAKALAQGADTGLAERLRRCVSATSSFLSTAIPEISNPDEVRYPPVVAFLRLKVAPGKMDEYLNLYKAEMLPAIKKAEFHVFASSRRLGTDGYDLTFETPLTKFADLDVPPLLVRALGPAEVARITAKLNPFATVMENTILMLQPDLSF
jgi:hypothetical protein